MRIAFAMINCNRRDGSARAVNEVAERLARRGHDVHLFARQAEDLDLQLIKWHHVPGPTWPEVADFLSYHRATDALLRRHDFDIVHSIGPNTSRANVVTIQNIQPAKMKILQRHAGDEKISPLRRFTRWLYLRTTSAAEKELYTRQPGPLFLPVSRGVEAELRQHYAIGNSPVRIVPNAADTAIFHPISQPERSQWRAANGFADDDIICLFSGGEWARKGLDLAIRGVLGVSHPKLKLFIAGDDPDRQRFKDMAQEGGSRFTFGGFRQDMATAMAASDLFLFPSHYEAFSLATIEAAACGLPIVATSINGTEDFVLPGENGAFVTHDPANIAATLSTLIQDLPALRAMGENARQLVTSRYTWDKVTDLTEQAYRTIVP
ncbi:glycosyltransferase family 4 protein [soil metagenome]